MVDPEVGAVMESSCAPYSDNSFSLSEKIEEGGRLLLGASSLLQTSEHIIV